MDRPVALAHTDRIVAPVQVTWLRRALRNLIENALRYGGTAQVSHLLPCEATRLRRRHVVNAFILRDQAVQVKRVRPRIVGSSVLFRVVLVLVIGLALRTGGG